MDEQRSGDAEGTSRIETVVDVATRSAAVGLGALLDRPMDPGPEGAPATPLFPLDHWLRFAPSTPMSELGADGHPRREGLRAASGLPRRMWAGSSIEFHRPVFVGQALTRVTTTESIVPKQGSTGRLCFVTLRHEVSADGGLALVERQTLVYREAEEKATTASGPRPDAPPPEGWEWSRQVRPGEVALFRYSALTFNAHRIHYDLAYATGVEGYPGLVVHGPLMATLLLDAFLRAHPGAAPLSFSFTARSPVFANELLHLCGRPAARGKTAGREASGVQELAVVGPGGRTIVTGHVAYRDA